MFPDCKRKTAIPGNMETQIEIWTRILALRGGRANHCATVLPLLIVFHLIQYWGSPPGKNISGAGQNTPRTERYRWAHSHYIRQFGASYFTLNPWNMETPPRSRFKPEILCVKVDVLTDYTLSAAPYPMLLNGIPNTH